MCVCSEAQSCQTLCSPWTVAGQTPLYLEFSRQKYWSELLFPTLGDIPDPGIEPASLMSLALVNSLPLHTWKPKGSRPTTYKATRKVKTQK